MTVNTRLNIEQVDGVSRRNKAWRMLGEPMNELATVAEQLENVLQSRLSGRVHDLQVECQTAGVVLRGWTRTYYAKQLAQHAAIAASGLSILANDIEVR
ncbi:MAG: BON domain-containing protein [Pirellulaceae bacterium]|nr:BON domain-containing protein [Pirellulaceae bacterium]